MSQLKVAAVQYPLDEGLQPAAFFTKMTSYIREAKNEGAELIVFPELITTELVDWSKPERPQLTEIARSFAPEFESFLKSEAQHISILGGTTPRAIKNQIVNTAILVLSGGQVFRQDKLFLTPDEKEWGWSGGTTLNVIESPWGRLVISICFDTEFPSVSQLLSSEKPDLILVPSWTSTHSGLNRVDFTARARAVEHYAYVIKTGTVPVEGGTQPHYGQASFHTPQETGFPIEPQNGLLNAPQILYATLDLKFMRERKALSGYYPSNEQSLRRTPISVERL